MTERLSSVVSLVDGSNGEESETDNSAAEPAVTGSSVAGDAVARRFLDGPAVSADVSARRLHDACISVEGAAAGQRRRDTSLLEWRGL